MNTLNFILYKVKNTYYNNYIEKRIRIRMLEIIIENENWLNNQRITPKERQCWLDCLEFAELEKEGRREWLKYYESIK